MGKMLLRFVKYFNPIFRRQGVDTDMLYAIVQLKLLMDTRRVYMSWKQRQQKENKNQLTFTLFMYGIFGGMVAMTIPEMPLLVSMILVHAFVIFILAMTLVTDFSAVLLDTTDNQVILPRPVNSKTLFMARLVHILIYLLQFSIAICILPVIIAFVTKGPVIGLMLILTTQLAVLLSVSFTYILYLLVLTFSNEEKVKDIVSYFQIGMTIFFVIGYQVIPRLLTAVDMNFVFTPTWYSALLPPVWMAMAIEAVSQLNFDWMHIIMLLLALLGPVILFWVMNKYLAPGFAKKLDALNTGGSAKVVDKHKAQQVKAGGLSTFFSNIVCRFPVEKAAFTNAWKITGRDKSFRLQFYPAFGYIAVFIFLFVFNSGRNMGAAIAGLPESNKFLILIYLPLFTLSSVLSIITFSDNFQASWVYHSVPVARPGEILTGTIKAMVVKFFMPIYLLFFVIALFVWGPGVTDDFVLGLFSSLLCLMVLSSLSERYLPFSRQPNVKQQSGKLIMMILQMFVIAALIGVHFLLLGKSLFIYGVSVVTAGLFLLLVKNLQSIKWNKISV